METMETRKRRLGDRKDGYLLRDLDALHFVTGVLYPNRCDNEAYIAERVDLSNIKAYIAKQNETETEFKYTFFHVVLAALLKTILLRPQLNRFVVNGNFYQRKELSAAFVVKKQFADTGGEALAFIRAKDEDTVQSIHEAIRAKVTRARSGGEDTTEDAMEILNKVPRFLAKFFIHIMMWLDKHGWVPKSLISSDPYYSSVLISNLGSIKLKSGYHHLTNWGTCSMFCIIGEKKFSPFYQQDGSVEMRETLDLGLTIDERIADGYYYSKSIRLFKYLREHPEELEKPFGEEVDYEPAK